MVLNGLSPHPGKTEYMLLGRGKFVGPLQDIKFGNWFLDVWDWKLTVS